MEPDLPEQPAATVVAIDYSWDTGLRGSFESIKSTAIALVDFIGSHHPADQVSIVRFSAYAEAIDAGQLATLTCDESVLGTNMHHALILASEWLHERPERFKEVIMLTDGVPTAHLERNRSYFAYPPSPITFRATSDAIRDCTRAEIDVTLYLTHPEAFAASALEWTLGGDREALKRVYVVPSSPAGLNGAVMSFYARRKLFRSRNAFR